VKRQLAKPCFTRVHPALAEEAELVCKSVHDLAAAVEKLLVAHGRDVIERQFHQERLANAAIDIYLSTATLSRASWAIERAGGPEKAAADVDNARIFVSMAMRRTRRALRALEHHQDGRLKAIAERALESGSLTVETPTDT
jgi:very long chain acyl-CoA dehydrogenase